MIFSVPFSGAEPAVPSHRLSDIPHLSFQLRADYAFSRSSCGGQIFSVISLKKSISTPGRTAE
jgi:hypothetical protein